MTPTTATTKASDSMLKSFDTELKCDTPKPFPDDEKKPADANPGPHYTDLYDPLGRMHMHLLQHYENIGPVVKAGHTVRILDVPAGLTLKNLTFQIRGGAIMRLFFLNSAAHVIFMRPSDALSYVFYVSSKFGGRISWLIAGEEWLHSTVELQDALRWKMRPMAQDVAVLVRNEGASRVLKISGLVGIVDLGRLRRRIGTVEAVAGSEDAVVGMMADTLGTVVVEFQSVSIAVKVRWALEKMDETRECVFEWERDPCDRPLEELLERNWPEGMAPGETGGLDGVVEV